MRPAEPMVAVRYIGRKDYWKDKPSLYGSGLDFEKGQVRVVPARLGKSFLRHKDLFERADAAPVPGGNGKGDDTQELLASGEARRDALRTEESRRLDVMEQVDRMDEGALVEYAEIHFRQKIKADGRKNQANRVDELRSQVRELIDRFGL